MRIAPFLFIAAVIANGVYAVPSCAEPPGAYVRGHLRAGPEYRTLNLGVLPTGKHYVILAWGSLGVPSGKPGVIDGHIGPTGFANHEKPPYGARFLDMDRGCMLIANDVGHQCFMLEERHGVEVGNEQHDGPQIQYPAYWKPILGNNRQHELLINFENADVSGKFYGELYYVAIDVEDCIRGGTEKRPCPFNPDGTYR